MDHMSYDYILECWPKSIQTTSGRAAVQYRER